MKFIKNIAIILLLCASVSIAQEFTTHTFSVKDGISSSWLLPAGMVPVEVWSFDNDTTVHLGFEFSADDSNWVTKGSYNYDSTAYTVIIRGDSVLSAPLVALNMYGTKGSYSTEDEKVYMRIYTTISQWANYIIRFTWYTGRD